MNRKVALITGITGQDGSYLAELLLEKGYDVHGTIRRSSTDYRERIAHLEGRPNFHLHYADLGDSMSIIQVMNKVKPTEVYNLAAQSHVQVSFDSPEFTADVDATGVLRILEAIRQCGLEKTCRMYQANLILILLLSCQKVPFIPISIALCDFKSDSLSVGLLRLFIFAYGLISCFVIKFHSFSQNESSSFSSHTISFG